MKDYYYEREWRNLLRPFTGKKQDWITKRFKTIRFVEDIPLLKKEDILISSLSGLDPYTGRPLQYSLKTNFHQRYPEDSPYFYQYDLYDVIRDENGAWWWTKRNPGLDDWAYPQYSDPIEAFHSRHDGYNLKKIINNNKFIYLYTGELVQEFINWYDEYPLEVKQ